MQAFVVDRTEVVDRGVMTARVAAWWHPHPHPLEQARLQKRRVKALLARHGKRALSADEVLVRLGTAPLMLASGSRAPCVVTSSTTLNPPRDVPLRRKRLGLRPEISHGTTGRALPQAFHGR